MQLKLFFSQVTFAKPKSSRNSSIGESLYGLALHLIDRISDIIDDLEIDTVLGILFFLAERKC
jgi:hypothetical protein